MGRISGQREGNTYETNHFNGIVQSALRPLLVVAALPFREAYGRYPGAGEIRAPEEIVLHANKGGRVKIDVHGKEHIPTDQSFVFFPNHQGLFDVLAILEACDVPFSVVAKKEVKDVPFLKQVFAIMKAKSWTGRTCASPCR